MAAIRFRAASRHGQSAFGRLPELTPGYGLNLRLGRGQDCNVAGLDFGGTAVFAMHLAAGECSIVGTPELDDSFTMVFIVDGELGIVGGPGVPLAEGGRGDVWIFGRDAEFGVSVSENVQLVAVTLPVQVLEEFGLTESRTPQALGPDSTMLTPVLGFLREIAVQDVEVPSLASYFMEKLVHEMVAGIMLENRGTRFAATPRKGFFGQAMDYIAATAGDGSLTPVKLAEELSLSLRQLQREFKQNNTSIAAMILKQRTELAVRLLRDPKLEVLPLDEVAEHSGFSSAIQMRRALNAAQAGSPSEIRARARSQRARV